MRGSIHEFSDIGRSLVTFFINVIMSGFSLIISLDAFASFIDGYITLDMLTRSVEQICRYLQPIHILKTDGSLPRISLLLLSRLPVNYVLVKFGHDKTSIIIVNNPDLRKVIAE